MMDMQDFIGTLHRVIDTSSSTEGDDRLIQSVLRVGGFPSCRIVYGVCYLEGQGRPISVQQAAEQLLKALERGDIAPESPEFNEGYAVEGDDYLYAEEDDEMTYDVVCEEPEEFDPDLEYDAFNEESRTVEW